MRIKSFTILVYMLAGLALAIFTSLMTYVIIGKPIGMLMVKQIIMVVLSVAPAIGVLSYFFAHYLSKKFIWIEQRLERIKAQDFERDESQTALVEINDINQNINILAEKMDRLIADLKQKNKTLADLLVSMAHDIKTPITILYGHMEEIEDGLVDPSMLPEVLAHMKAELTFIDELTVDMLQYIESMGNKRGRRNIAVFDILQDKVLPLLPNKEGVVAINTVDENLRLSFNCTDFKRISVNILMNAVKFTEQGYVKVYNEENTIVFENTGTKIDLDLREDIFKPFYTVDKSKNRKQSGFGLGLSIVKNLSENNAYRCFLYASSDEKTVFKLEPQSINTTQIHSEAGVMS